MNTTTEEISMTSTTVEMSIRFLPGTGPCPKCGTDPGCRWPEVVFALCWDGTALCPDCTERIDPTVPAVLAALDAIDTALFEARPSERAGVGMALLDGMHVAMEFREAADDATEDATKETSR